MVKELRETTGAGMMDCKAALDETKGDMQAAVDWLRKKGLSKAAKKAGRVAAEGLIGVAVTGNKGVVVEVNSETDFVARNDLFQGLVKMIADVALTAGTDVSKTQRRQGGQHHRRRIHCRHHCQDRREHDAAPRRQRQRRQGRDRQLCARLDRDGLGRIGVLVGLSSNGKADELAAIGRQVAMHIASTNPLAIDPSGVEPAVIKREKDILADKFRQQGKPEAMIEKIVESGLKTFYKEQTLLEQPFIFDDSGKKSVAQALKEIEGKVGAPVKLTGFVRFALGEGIEKQETDFAAEVAATAGQR